MAVAYGAAGGPAYSTGNPAPAYPAGITAGQYLVLLIGSKPGTSVATDPAGWTSLGVMVSTSAVATGIDVGPTRVRAYGKTASGSETGTLAITITGNNISWAQILRFTNATGIWNAVAATGEDLTGGAAYSATMTTDPGLTTGDMCLVAVATPTDVGAGAQFTAEAISANGVNTWGSLVEVSEPVSSLGQDIGGVVFYRPVFSGTSNGAPTVTATAAGTTTNVYGPAILVRLREVSPPTAPTTAPTATASASGVLVTVPATLEGGATTYGLYRDGTFIGGGKTAGVEHNDISASVVAYQTYTVRGVNQAGTSTDSPASAAVAANPLPSVPSLVAALGQVTVSLGRKSYAARYKVYRGLSGGARTLVHTSTDQVTNGTYEWIDTGVVNESTYDYHVTTEAQTPTVRESAASVVASAKPTAAIFLTYDYPATTVTTWTVPANIYSVHMEAWGAVNVSLQLGGKVGADYISTPGEVFSITCGAEDTSPGKTTTQIVSDLHATYLIRAIGGSDIGGGGIGQSSIWVTETLNQTATSSDSRIIISYLPPASSTPIVGSETNITSITESASIVQSAVIVVGTEVPTISTTEFASVNLVTVATADSGTRSIAESASTAIFGAVSESPIISIVELTAALATLTTIDSGAISIGESVSITVSNVVAATDTVTTSITESVTNAISRATTDSGVTSISESTSTQAVATVTDTGIRSIVESVLISVTSMGTDSGAITLSSEVSSLTGIANIQSVDTGTASIAESALAAVSAIITTDSGTTFIAESVATGANATATDTETLLIVESISIYVTVSTADAGVTSITEDALAAPLAAAPGAVVTGIFSVTELYDLVTIFSTVDSGIGSTAEAPAVTGISVAVDSETLSTTESTVTQAYAVVVDSGTTMISEVTAAFASLISIDGGTISTTDTSATVVDNYAVASDVSTLSVIESVSTAAAGTAIDLGSILLSEVSNLTGAANIQSTDTATTAATDTVSTIGSVTFVTDTGAVSIVELASTLASTSSTDTGNTSILDSSNIVAGGVLDVIASNTGTTSVVDIANVVIITIQVGTDTGTIGLGAGGGGGTTTWTHLVQNATTTFTVPVGVTSVVLEVFAPLAGWSGFKQAGGYAKGTYACAPGDVLTIHNGYDATTSPTTTYVSAPVKGTLVYATSAWDDGVMDSDIGHGYTTGYVTSPLASDAFWTGAAKTVITYTTGGGAGDATSSILVLLAPTDTGAISVTDTASLIKSIPSVDTGTLSITEVGQIGSTLSATDGVSTSAVEISLVVVTRVAADTGTTSIAETTQTVVSGVTASSAIDSGSISIVESTTKAVSGTAIDIGTISIIEAVSTWVTTNSTDVGTTSASDSSSLSGAGGTATSDSGTTSIVEVSSVAISAITTTDSGTASIVESVVTMIRASVIEVETLSIAESVLTHVVALTTDVGTSSISEGALVDIISTTPGTATGIFSIEESYVIISISSTVDGGTLSTTDLSSIANQSTATDSGTRSAVESTAIQAYAITTDSGTATISEITTTETNSAGADVETLSITDVGALVIANLAIATDTDTISVGEETSIATTLESSDAETLSVNDVAIVKNEVTPVTSNDAGAVSVVEDSVIDFIITQTDIGTTSALETSLISVPGLILYAASDSCIIYVAEFEKVARVLPGNGRRPNIHPPVGSKDGMHNPAKTLRQIFKPRRYGP